MRSTPLRLALVLAAMLLCGAAVAGTAAAATQYVSPEGVALTNTSCTFPGYNTIQAAVTASAPGDTIVVCDGVYNERVTVSKNLTLAGSGNATIKAPAGTAAGDNVVQVDSAAIVTMTGLTVSGPVPAGGCGEAIGSGIAVFGGASLDLSNSAVRDIRLTPGGLAGLGGCQNGVGILVGRVDNNPPLSEVGHATIDHVVVSGYQKGGILVDNTGSTARITNTTVTGDGKTDVIAQNGIQVSRGAAATITTSTIRDNWYTPKSSVACGLFINDANGVNDANNVFLNNEKNKCTFSGRGGTYEGA
jgi:hypothetical protein